MQSSLESVLMNKSCSVAITGIDGSGKSTLSEKIQASLKHCGHEETCVIRCPVFHETPNAPLSVLSQDLDAFSTIADTIKNVELKAIAQFIQLTLFGPVTDCLTNTFQPGLVIHERHAVVDCYAYGKFYETLMKIPPDQSTFESSLKKQLELYRPGAWKSILNWIDLFAERTGLSLSLWNAHHHIKDIFSKNGRALIQALETITGASLPDVLVILDADPDLAEKRIDTRNNGKEEFHEQSSHLSEIRNRYFDLMDLLKNDYPELKTTVVKMNDSKGINDTVDEITRYICNESE